MHPEPDPARVAAHQRRYFNQLAGVFDAPQPAEVIERLRQIVAAAELRPGETVLDVGTGAGVLLPLIQSYGPSRVLACDLAELMLDRARRNHPRVLFFQCDVVRAPFKAGCLDAVFMNAMFGNLADKTAVCSHAAGALKPGGRLIVSHPEGTAFVDRLRAAGDLFIERFPTREEFRELLAPVGLDLILYRDEPKLFVMVARKPPDLS
jgi:SAM-dependent methyltransferase